MGGRVKHYHEQQRIRITTLLNEREKTVLDKICKEGNYSKYLRDLIIQKGLESGVRAQ